MGIVWIYTLCSVLVVSIISLIGIITISFKEGLLKEILLYLVSFSAGVLLGDTFIHLLPETFESGGFGLAMSLSVLSGIVFFFILEKLISWRHCHIVTSKEHPHPVAYMNLIGDGFHNFIDGMIIAGSYLVSLPVGLATTIAVITHEIPQEMGDFGVLIYGGFSRGGALALNFLSATAAFLGAVVILVLSMKTRNITVFLVPFTAGGFIYIAASDLIPELKKHISPLNSLLELSCLMLGILIMLALKLWG
jgi:zinc and cadmium transporter